MKHLLAALVLCLAAPAWGTPQQEEPLVIVSRTVELRLEENFGLLQVQFKVKNPTDKALEGEVRFSVPAGAAVYEADLLKHISSTERKSKLVTPNQATAFYALAKNSVKDTAEEALIAAAMTKKYPKAYYDTKKDPAIIEYVSEDRYRLRFFPVPARDNQTVTYRVAFEIPKEDGAQVATVPLCWDTPMKSAPDAVAETRVVVRSSDDLGAVTSPSHRLGSIQRHAEAHRFAAVVEPAVPLEPATLRTLTPPSVRRKSLPSPRPWCTSTVWPHRSSSMTKWRSLQIRRFDRLAAHGHSREIRLSPAARSPPSPSPSTSPRATADPRHTGPPTSRSISRAR
jgi:hypothetical protein